MTLDGKGKQFKQKRMKESRKRAQQNNVTEELSCRRSSWKTSTRERWRFVWAIFKRAEKRRTREAVRDAAVAVGTAVGAGAHEEKEIFQIGEMNGKKAINSGRKRKEKK
ncbi:hypothetical protein RUM43_002950 [Polyplax serrata]|uniref:Uncharacterized protein n=1 Tax=Polyplax serrata TaxID=468196 RepID=A0AAN8Q054_POLSC